MIVAITGATGFIGRKLAEHHIAAGDSVRLLSRRTREAAGFSNAVTVCTCDLAKSTHGLAAFADGADVLYHCAGETRNQGLMHDVHVEGMKRLWLAATGRVGRWVQLSSVGVYGPRRTGEVTEESEWAPVGVYEQTKAEADRIVLDATVEDGTPVVILRPSNVFGGTMRNQSLFGMASMIKRGAFFFIGRPGASANYIHVDNVVAALVRCGCHRDAAGHVFNLSDWTTVEEFVAGMAVAIGSPTPTLRLPEKLMRLAANTIGRIPKAPLTLSRVNALTIRAIYPIDSIEQTLGYCHPVTMEHGINDLIEAWRAQALR